MILQVQDGLMFLPSKHHFLWHFLAPSHPCRFFLGANETIKSIFRCLPITGGGNLRRPGMQQKWSKRSANDSTESGWWFQILFIFTPTWVNDPIWRAYFSKGFVQPPTRTGGSLSNKFQNPDFSLGVKWILQSGLKFEPPKNHQETDLVAEIWHPNGGARDPSERGNKVGFENLYSAWMSRRISGL